LTSDKWIGVHTGGAHCLDHLGVLCQGLEVPLFVTEESTFNAARQFYPGLQVEYIELRDLTLYFLAQRADVIFETGYMFAAELIPLWELMHGKKMRVVYCPHGNSDKKIPPVKKDLSLVYGDYMKNQLEDVRLEKMVVTGNYRAAYYRTHQEWYDTQLQLFLGDLPDKKTLLYAPSWEEDNWFSVSLKVIKEIGPQFNLFVRLHPLIEEKFPAEVEQIKSLGGIDLSRFPLIYPILNLSDFYLGDRSSIGYDFLSMNKPLFFLDRYEGDIYECGVVLSKDQHYGEAIASFRDSSVLQKKRRELSARVFGNEKSFKQIKDEIQEALSLDRAPWVVI
jgi:hypothetical protein